MIFIIMWCGENDMNARDLPPWTLEEGAQGVDPLLILEVEANTHLGEEWPKEAAWFLGKERLTKKQPGF